MSQQDPFEATKAVYTKWEALWVDLSRQEGRCPNGDAVAVQAKVDTLEALKNDLCAQGWDVRGVIYGQHNTHHLELWVGGIQILHLSTNTPVWGSLCVSMWDMLDPNIRSRHQMHPLSPQGGPMWKDAQPLLEAIPAVLRKRRAVLEAEGQRLLHLAKALR